MRRIAQLLLVVFAFATPWEFVLELGEPFGPIARIAGILLLLAAVPAILQAGRIRSPGVMQWVVLALYLWFCCSCVWTIDEAATLEKLRAYFQEMMIVWLVWEFADGTRNLRMLFKAYVAGAWVLAAVTLANFASPEAIASGQIRFFAEGLDPNDTARFLDLGFPMAALLVDADSSRLGRLLALGYFPAGALAVLLTASRGGFIAAVLALAGSAVLLARRSPRRVLAGALALPAFAAALWLIVPYDTLQRLATISEQLEGGNLNERVNIWELGWHAFAQAPLLGTGAGSFVAAARLSPIDTAHNTALSIIVGGGLCALLLAAAVLALAVRSVLTMRGPLLLAMGTALLVWMVTTLTAAVEENRSTWLLFALIALAGRLAAEEPEALAACFPADARPPAFKFAVEPLP
ncbi:MAG: O-antigen ligase family protein [Terracidiphilus sp.]